MKRNRVAATAAGAVIAIGGLGWGIPALADDDTSSGSSSRVEQMDERRAELAERLADELGLDVADVEAALAKVSEELRAEHDVERSAQMKERLDQAVEDGRLTQEQADSMLELAESGEFPGGRGGQRGHGGGHGGGFGGFGGGPGSDIAPDGGDGSVTPNPTGV